MGAGGVIRAAPVAGFDKKLCSVPFAKKHVVTSLSRGSLIWPCESVTQGNRVVNRPDYGEKHVEGE